MSEPQDLYITFEGGMHVGVFATPEGAESLNEVRRAKKGVEPVTVRYVPAYRLDAAQKAADTMLGNRKRGREIDWKRVADSYRDDLCALILAGNALKRCLRASVNAAEVAHAIEQWDDWLRIVTPEPICVHSTSPGEGVPAPEQTGALLSSEGPSAPGSPAPIKRGGPITTENHPWRK